MEATQRLKRLGEQMSRPIALGPLPMAFDALETLVYYVGPNATEPALGFRALE
jgi:hypothetical protein